MKTFKKKYGPWAIVTGASEGIGKAIAIELAKQNLNVLLVARNTKKLEALSTDLQKNYGVSTQSLPLDLSTLESNKMLFSAAEKKDVGLFCAVAGFGTSGDFVNLDIKRELNMVDLNCRAVVEQVHFFAEKFKQRGGGGLVLMSSLVAFQGVPRSSTYSATKAFIQNFAEGLYYELKPFNIDVLASSPGPVASAFAERADMKMGLAASPQEVAFPTLLALGQRITVRPGFVSKLLGWSLILLPRYWRIKLMKVIMGGMTEHKERQRSG